jgi:hypothetical protein
MAPPSDGRRRFLLPVLAGVVVVLGVPLTVFLPLILAGVEHVLFGTHEVEEFFRKIGVHDELSAIYEPVVDLFRHLFG